MKRKISIVVVAASLLAVAAIVPGCISEDIKDSYYTFTGQLVAQYLESDPRIYSEFYKVLDKTGLVPMLNAYGQYTCFAPTNTAMKIYLAELELDSVGQLSDKDLKYLAYTHIIGAKYLVSDFGQGAIPTLNMNERYLSVTLSGPDIYINTDSRILQPSEEVHNGVVHKIDKVLAPSVLMLPDKIMEDERLSLFHEALILTKVDKLLRELDDFDYAERTRDFSGSYPKPVSRKFGYTAFVETNEVFANNNPSIRNMDDLKAYAAKIYDEVFPEDAGITDVTDRRNSLNRFMAYHFIDRTMNYNQIIYPDNNVSGFDVYEYTETMGNMLLEVSNGKGANGGLIINKYLVGKDDYRGVMIIPQEIAAGGIDQSCLNGVYHLIDKVLVYDKTNVVDKVLNKRMRIDVTSMLPELTTNAIRGPAYGRNKRTSLPPGYCKNLEVSPESDVIYISPPNPNTYSNYQGDELMIVRQYDFTLRLPAVPPGNYEIRLGYTPNASRGIAQIYLGTKSEGLLPVGIPLDMRVMPTNPKIGWIADANTPDNGYENDKMMRNRGYMKAPDTFISGTGSTGGNNGPARNATASMRRIITVKDIVQGETYYMRVKSVIESSTTQFHFDYLEFAPKSVYANPDGEDRH